jgi:hypothetical protein
MTASLDRIARSGDNSSVADERQRGPKLVQICAPGSQFAPEPLISRDRGRRCLQPGRGDFAELGRLYWPPVPTMKSTVWLDERTAEADAECVPS